MDSERGVSVSENESAIFQSNLPLGEKLDRARKQLLDLSARNRLLNMPRGANKARAIEVIDEKTSEVFRLLVRDGKAFTFVAGRAAETDGMEDSANNADSGGIDSDEVAILIQPDDDSRDDRGVLRRHADTRLQTRLTGAGLQKRLLELYLDSRTLEEEQGVNVLFLTLGALKWIDPNNRENVRYAPLLLVPVSLERGHAGERFNLRARPEDFASNLSLEAYLDRVHTLRMPAFEASDTFDPNSYIEEVKVCIQSKPDWEVLIDDISIGFFSFAKFLMYRDLDPLNWPQDKRITDQRLVRGLLSEGFSGGDGMADEDANIDPLIPSAEMLHILDCDSSQALAIHEVRRGRDLVIQGPPGTGKSQTISNIIAAAVKDGKTVLFVAEKMAALEVVKRRLDDKGVGDACLELHSNKTNKRAVLEELRRTWELGAPRGAEPGSLFDRLTQARDSLNEHVKRLHEIDIPSGLSPHHVMGQLARLRAEGVVANDLALTSPELWGIDGFEKRRNLLADLASRVEVIGTPSAHAWAGVQIDSIIPTEVDRLQTKIKSLSGHLKNAIGHFQQVAALVELNPPVFFKDIETVRELCRRIAPAPSLSTDAMGHDVWLQSELVNALLNHLKIFTGVQLSLRGKVLDQAWDLDLSDVRAVFESLPPDFGVEEFQRFDKAVDVLPRLLGEAEGLSKALGRGAVTTLVELKVLARIGDRVASAPEASPQTFASELWNDGVERAGDLADAVAVLEASRSELSNKIAGMAWDMELSVTRATIAHHGSSFLRFLSGEWRRANRTVKSIFISPNQPLPVVLALLDTLARGQVAKRAIEESDGFGRSAFGDDWRGEKSKSTPLLALVEWMRSLKGLGAEPRLIASRGPQKGEIAQRSQRLSNVLSSSIAFLEQMWTDLSLATFTDAREKENRDAANLKFLCLLAQKVVQAQAQLQTIAIDPPTTTVPILELLNRLAEGQRARNSIRNESQIGQHAFGPAWKGEESDWVTLKGAADWVVANPDIRALAGRISERSSLLAKSNFLLNAKTLVLNDFNAIASTLELNLPAALGATNLEECSIERMSTRLSRWIDEREQVFRWVAYRDMVAQVTRLGCADPVDRLSNGAIDPKSLVPAFEMAFFEATYKRVVGDRPELKKFDGFTHARLVSEFSSLDRERISAAQIEVVRAHHRGVPARDGGSVGPLGVLRGEIQKKRAHMPLRKLIEKAGPALKALKPVFMMSPLSVAQFLPPGAMTFDLLVMDEASQIQPVDALGAVARGNQVVIVGDPKQLPPTSFFAKMTASADDEDEDDNGTPIGDIESVLGLFAARGLPMRMLRWHYRSRHQSLIAVSNQQFYENKLFIVPSPETVQGGGGLRFHYVADGLFDTGNKRSNPVEAKHVALAIIDHAKAFPKLSLGVAAFSAAQRRAIIDELELLRRGLSAEVEEFFKAHRTEPFFIKNLENVQGDERDVIFISVGYGRASPGARVPMRFGPIGLEGGERRLNVLISRAKRRCDVFASMTDEDIDPNFAAGKKGVSAFRLFLQFARTGRLVSSEQVVEKSDSLLEQQVASALRSKGYEVVPRIGIGGFLIDMAIIDSERPGRYLLGIECDGESYRGARSARDRDRLRQSVLQEHGWSIHRIWSIDWFQRPQEQLNLLIQRIEAAKKDFDERQSEAFLTDQLDTEAPYVEREESTEPGDRNVTFTKYVEAEVKRPQGLTADLHEAPQSKLVELAVQIVTVEGPLHIEQITSRIRDAWGLKRSGQRIEDAVRRSLQAAVHGRRVAQHGQFFSLPDRVAEPRDRSEVKVVSLRKAEMLPPQEIESAIECVLHENFGATRQQVIHAVARGFGIKSVSAQIRATIDEVVTLCVSERKFREVGGMLTNNRKSSS